MLQRAFDEQTLSERNVYKRYKHFQGGRELIKNGKRHQRFGAQKPSIGSYWDIVQNMGQDRRHHAKVAQKSR